MNDGSQARSGRQRMESPPAGLRLEGRRLCCGRPSPLLRRDKRKTKLILTNTSATSVLCQGIRSCL